MKILEKCLQFVSGGLQIGVWCPCWSVGSYWNRVVEPSQYVCPLGPGKNRVGCPPDPGRNQVGVLHVLLFLFIAIHLSRISRLTCYKENPSCVSARL
jgi:hypothetical protein